MKHKTRIRTPTRTRGRHPAKPIRRSKPARHPMARSGGAGSPGRRRLLATLRRFESAAALLTARADALSDCAAELTALAAAQERERLVLRLAESNVLDHLKGLDQVLSSRQDELPPALGPFREAVAGLFEWLRSELRLVPLHQPGEKLVLGEAELEKVRFAVPPDRTPRCPVEVQVTAPGWKMDGRALVRPAVQLSPGLSVSATRD